MSKIENTNTKRGKALLGTVFIVAGSLLLLGQLGLNLPSWLFSGPMVLVILGLYLGVKSQFKNTAPLILIGIGAILLLKRIIDLETEIFWPVVIIGVGLLLIFNKSNRIGYGGSSISWKTKDLDWDKRSGINADENEASAEGETSSNDYHVSDDYVESTSIFGGVKKNILSKKFKGGEITNFFGGAEINLMHADIETTAVLDVTQVFGGTKIIIPAHWIVKSEMVAVFGSIEDRRPTYSQEQSQKVLLIKGTSVFAGIDIKSY